MPEYDIKLAGFEQISSELNGFTDREVKNALRTAVRAAGQTIRTIVKNKAPVGKGELYVTVKGKVKSKHYKDTIEFKMRNPSQTGGAIVGRVYSRSPLAHLLEYGHNIVPRGGKAKKGGIFGIGKKSKQVIGFVAAIPHFRPAVKLGRGRAIRAFKAGLEKAILRHGNKHA